jgi:hypothetical protein
MLDKPSSSSSIYLSCMTFIFIFIFFFHLFFIHSYAFFKLFVFSLSLSLSLSRSFSIFLSFFIFFLYIYFFFISLFGWNGISCGRCFLICMSVALTQRTYILVQPQPDPQPRIHTLTHVSGSERLLSYAVRMYSCLDENIAARVVSVLDFKVF